MTQNLDVGALIIQSLFSAIPMILKTLWPFWVAYSLFLIGKLALVLYKKHKLAKVGMNEIDKMDGKTFESYLATLFQKMGYSVKQVGSFAGDYGADLIITKEGNTIAVQAKRHKSLIGVDAVREALGSIKMYKCNGAMVVTNSYFTKQAKKLAKANSIELWNRFVLANKILISFRLMVLKNNRGA